MNAPPWKELPDRANQHRILELHETRGSIEMFSPLPSVLVSRASGHMSEAFADGWVKATKRVTDGKQPIQVFNDWTLMEGYDSAARRKLTDWVLSHRTQISRTHFTVTSRIVSMGVSVAGAALALASISVESLPRQEFVARLKVALEGERSRT